MCTIQVILQLVKGEKLPSMERIVTNMDCLISMSSIECNRGYNMYT